MWQEHNQWPSNIVKNSEAKSYTYMVEKTIADALGGRLDKRMKEMGKESKIDGLR